MTKSRIEPLQEAMAEPPVESSAEPILEDEWTEDDWGEEEAAPPVARRRASGGRGRWRAFALGAAGGAALLAGFALLGGGEGGRDRALSPEVAASFAAPPPFSQNGAAAPSARRLTEAPPLRPPGGGEGWEPLVTGDIPPRAAARLPPPPAFAPPGDWEQGWAPMELAEDFAPPHLAPPLSSRSASSAPALGDLEPQIEAGLAEEAPPNAALNAAGPPADPGAPEAMRLETALLAPPGAEPAPVLDLAAPPPPAAALAPEPEPSAAPEAEPEAAPKAESGPADSPAPRPKPLKPEHAAAPLSAPSLAPPLAPSLASEPGADPDVYSPPSPLRAASVEAAPSPRGGRGGWSSRLKLEGGPEIALAAAPPPPLHDPAPAGSAPIHDPGLAASAPLHDPEPIRVAAREAPEPTGSEPPPMISAAVEFGGGFGAEFGPEITSEAFAAMALAPDALETGDLPQVRRAPIDRPDDGPFSARSETPAAASAPRRRAAEPALPPDAPRAMVVLTALGLHEAVTLRAMRETPDAVALAFAPIGRRVEDRVASLGAAGRVALVEAPMEAMTRSSTPEEITLATGVAAEENQARLAKVLAVAPKAAGISTYMGARFTADQQALAGVLPFLAGRGLFVLENQPTNRSLLRDSARGAGVRYAAAPMALDRERSATAIRTALAQLERRALADGEAVGVMAVSNEALDALALWTEGLASRGVRLAPLREALE